MTYRDAKRFVAANCPHIKIRNNAEIGEIRVAYKGLKPDREESMAYYTEDIEDAIGTAATMERDYMLCVHNCDKLPKTLQLEHRKAATLAPRVRCPGCGISVFTSSDATTPYCTSCQRAASFG